MEIQAQVQILAHRLTKLKAETEAEAENEATSAGPQAQPTTQALVVAGSTASSSLGNIGDMGVTAVTGLPIMQSQAMSLQWWRCFIGCRHGSSGSRTHLVPMGPNWISCCRRKAALASSS